MNIDVTVVMCTYNRAPVLADALRSWLDVDTGHVTVEFLVIDNASTDGTNDVVARFVPDFRCRLRYVYEATAGLSYARNRGIDEANGPIIAFVDDDVYFDAGWLQAIVRAFERHPQTYGIGGKSIPAFEADQPSWLTPSMLSYYGSAMSGNDDGSMRFPEHPFGVNMAFRREVFSRVGRFNTALGRIGTSLRSNEETDVFCRMSIAGLDVRYCSEAVVHHRVPAERLERRWLLRRSYWQGISDVILDQSVRRSSRRILCSRMLQGLKRAILGRGGAIGMFARHEESSLERKMKAYHQLGVARQSLVEVLSGSSARKSYEERRLQEDL